jgi:hypothetical protein
LSKENAANLFELLLCLDNLYAEIETNNQTALVPTKGTIYRKFWQILDIEQLVD